MVPAYLPTALSVALRPLFPFQQAQYAQVSLLKPVLFCKFFAGFGSTNKFATFLLFDSCHPVLSSIFSFTSISVADLAETFFCAIRLQWVLRHSFFLGNDVAD